MLSIKVRWTSMHVNQKPRRRHAEEFKAQVLAACAEPGASVSGGGAVRIECLQAGQTQASQQAAAMPAASAAGISPMTAMRSMSNLRPSMLASPSSQHFPDHFRVGFRDPDEGLGRTRGRTSALLPLLQRARLDERVHTRRYTSKTDSAQTRCGLTRRSSSWFRVAVGRAISIARLHPPDPHPSPRT
jgi:hypothetical protein